MEEPKDDQLEHRLAQTEVPEVRYKVDMELHDRSQNFSSELLKLSLAGIAVVGFLLAEIPDAYVARALGDRMLKFLFSASVFAFAVAVGCALLQRFYSAAAMFHHIKLIKLFWIKDSSLEEQATEDIRIRTSKFAVSHRCLKLAATFLLVGAALLGLAFIRLMTAVW
jgi:hypothetical protein